MTPEVTSALAEMGVSLTAYAVKGTVSAVTTRVKTIKNEKNAEILRNSYDEIISELLEEREEILRIAQAYRAELERIEISDEDIVHLHNTLEKVLDLLAQFSGVNEESVQSLKTFKDIVNVDTLKTMQLLGFNYKEAIGLPLTELCADAIKGIAKKGKANNKNKNR